MRAACRPIAEMLTRYEARNPVEAADVKRLEALLENVADPWRRTLPLHVTASALVVHPASARVLLRWHRRQGAWLQIGGHGDPGETDPLQIVLREGREETGLEDLVPWPDSQVLHVVVVPVPANDHEPAHEHVDLRFVLATDDPDAARPEDPGAPLRWLTLSEARELTAEDNLRETLARVEPVLTAA